MTVVLLARELAAPPAAVCHAQGRADCLGRLPACLTAC